MAVDIFNPPANSPIGPGIPYVVRDLAVPPVIPPAFWTIEVVDVELPSDTVLYRQTIPFEGTSPPQVGAIIGDRSVQHQFLPSGRTLTQSGDAVMFRARLMENAGSSIVSEGTIPGFWDDSYAWMLPLSSTTGGFTQTDRDNLALVQTAVRKVLPIAVPGGAQAVMQVIDLLRGPPRSLLKPFGTPLLLEGRGTIPVVPSGALFTFGGTWSWFTIPAGAGYRDGVLRMYQNRVLQLQVLREGADDSLYNDVILEENAEGGFVQWQVPNPTQVNYDLSPGWVALWRWLV